MTLRNKIDDTIKDQIADAMVASCLYLDQENFDNWLKLWSESGTYEIETFTPELRRAETLLYLTGPQIERVLHESSNHVRDGSTKTRICAPALVKLATSDTSLEITADASQRVAIYSTDLGGVSSLYALCSYEDSWSCQNAEIRLTHRKVTLITRNFSIGTHVLL